MDVLDPNCELCSLDSAYDHADTSEKGRRFAKYYVGTRGNEYPNGLVERHEEVFELRGWPVLSQSLIGNRLLELPVFPSESLDGSSSARVSETSE